VDELHELKKAFQEELGTVAGLEDLQKLKAKYSGRKGMVSAHLKKVSALPPEKRSQFGSTLNEIKKFIEDEVINLEASLKAEVRQKRLQTEFLDISLPGRRQLFGREHPINQVLTEVKDIFISLGFDVEDGPEVELDYYNFEALNIPKDHPARDMQDTFYVSEDIVLRTHTSPVQIRVMEKRTPPLRIIAPGKVYRCDADISHTAMFHQIEGLMVDKTIAFSDLKGVLELFIHRLFGKDTPVRFRPSYFPFTEPSAEVDIGCIFCGGRGCRVCKTTGWLEILGAGMVNPKVFEMVGYETDQYTGFAFGLGIERIAMLKYSIDDIRLFYENDCRFLSQF
jgi:phenylalanyl-tRNA synthetase alpha chain